MLLNLTFCIAPTEIILLLRQTDQTSLSDSVSFMEVRVHRFVCSITILYEKKNQQANTQAVRARIVMVITYLSFSFK